MAAEKKVGHSTIRLIRDDLTNLDVDAFVFYAQPDLSLGSGYGTAIAQRGGPKIQEELKNHGSLTTGEAITTSAGELKAKHIIHAVGPRFQESQSEEKLRQTTLSALRQAEKHDVKRLALPPMGTGFYGVPLPVCAKVTVATISEHLSKESGLDEVIICCTDHRQMPHFSSCLDQI